VAATSVAQNAVQSTISSSVAGTITAIPPIPTPTPIEVDTVTEEEIAALVDEALEEAMAASTTCATTASDAASDDSVTSEEAQSITVTVVASKEAIANATTLARQYLALYSEMGEETIALLQQMENDLSAMSTSTAEIAATLDEINSALQQRVALAEETITQLELQAAQIETQVAAMHEKADGWKKKVTTELENRTNLVNSLQPDQLASDRKGAFQQINQYVSLIKTSLRDGKLSNGEFTVISMAGTNASASIRQFGGAGGNSLANQISALTRNLARGETPQIFKGLSGLEKDFSGLGGNLTDKSIPNLPKFPARK
jgi:hypothetical protein